MGVASKYQEEYEKQKQVLEAMKAALVNASPEDAALLQSEIEIYESAQAEFEATDVSFVPPVMNVVQKIQATVYGSNGYVWDAEANYQPGQTCWHNDIEYRAADDVAKGIAPDDVYDVDANTGGWIPVNIPE